MKRDDFTLLLPFAHELIIDNFAGGGGTSTGLEKALAAPCEALARANFGHETAIDRSAAA